MKFLSLNLRAVSLGLAVAVLALPCQGQRTKYQKDLPKTHNEKMEELLRRVAPSYDDGAYAMLHQVRGEALQLRASMRFLKAAMLHADTDENKERMAAYEATAEAMAAIQSALTDLMDNITACESNCSKAERVIIDGKGDAKDHHAKMKEHSAAAVKAMTSLESALKKLVKVQAGTKDSRVERFSKTISARTEVLAKVVDVCNEAVGDSIEAQSHNH